MSWNHLGWAGVAGALTLTMFVPAAIADRPDGNGLAARALLYNALTTNPKSLQFLRDHPLNDSSFDVTKNEYMNLQLTDPSARAVMQYLVSCALDPSAQVKYTDPVSHAWHSWPGELGLCPSWSTGKPSEECLQRVSACLFARVNGLHRRIPVLLGGHNFGPRRDQLKVEIATVLPRGDPNAELSEGTPIGSFSGGWKPGYVGSCQPNSPVSLAVQDCAQTTLRVCKGLYGCNGSNGDAQQNPGFLQEKNGACNDSPLTFTCPAKGYYGVMTRPHKAAVTLQASGGGNYPSPASEVFSYIEGAFFGNLFEPEGLTRTCEMVLRDGHPERRRGAISGVSNEDDTVPHRNIYACYTLGLQEESSHRDPDGAAYLNARLCADPASKKKCFPNPPRRCHFRDPVANEEKGYHCKWLPDEGVFQDCRGDNGVSYPPITVRLHDPCNLIDDEELCGRLGPAAGQSADVGHAPPGLHHAPPGLHHLPPPPPGARGCGSCSVDDAGGAPLPTSAAALLAVLLCERRRRRWG